MSPNFSTLNSYLLKWSESTAIINKNRSCVFLWASAPRRRNGGATMVQGECGEVHFRLLVRVGARVTGVGSNFLCNLLTFYAIIAFISSKIRIFAAI